MSTRLNLCLCVLLLTLGVSGCFHVYKAEVPQGNIVTPEMLENLKLGMSKQQVRFLLGTPTIIDAFHPDRWDYVYWAAQGPRALTLFFQQDQLIRLDRAAPAGDG